MKFTSKVHAITLSTRHCMLMFFGLRLYFANTICERVHSSPLTKTVVVTQMCLTNELMKQIKYWTGYSQGTLHASPLKLWTVVVAQMC